MVYKPEITNWKSYERKRKIKKTWRKLTKKPSRILCYFGIHKYGQDLFKIWSQESHVKDYSKVCKRCGLTEKWVAERK